MEFEHLSSISYKMYPGFCRACGSILPLPTFEIVTCFTCKKEWNSEEVFSGLSSSFTLSCNAGFTYDDDDEGDENEVDGPVVERKCPQCDNDKMSYATLQLRSADEGQTVFYTCTKCKHKITENS